MSGTLPTVRNGSVGIYPLQRSTLATTGVAQFCNGSEQRWKKHAPLGQFQLVYNALTATDRNALKAFYATNLGQFNDTWSFTVGNTYTNCMFIDDTFSSVESEPNLYNVKFAFRQVATGGAPAGAGSSFPLTSTGAITQRPYTQNVRYRTAENTNPNGPSYSFAFYGGGLSGFPTRGLMGWTLAYPSISDADMAALEEFFIAMNGKYQTFSFTDPDSGTTYTSVRFDTDSFTYTYKAFGQASTTIQLIETN